MRVLETFRMLLNNEIFEMESRTSDSPAKVCSKDVTRTYWAAAYIEVVTL
ncbi:hypothetical protein [Pseudarthrobacter enclensis]|uniref:Uncharacterized protein n=1 Tax=Pseudarthrobacter enclensis TaxID=993070 RepID=A0ABT9RVI3_9MICC|nr:hypothetical protein [Pseudarthrobacter enclensis]MDP9888668.1 hypothetical protein [Pseudarthrobacter enclensis]